MLILITVLCIRSTEIIHLLSLMLTNLFLTKFLGKWNFQNLHFADCETKAQSVSALLIITKLVSGRAQFQPYIKSKVCTLFTFSSTSMLFCKRNFILFNPWNTFKKLTNLFYLEANYSVVVFIAIY